MNRARQRKLEARERRIASLANSSLASQEPITMPIVDVIEKSNIEADKKIETKPIRDVSRIELVKKMKKQNKLKNLAGAKKSATKTKGKEKIK